MCMVTALRLSGHTDATHSSIVLLQLVFASGYHKLVGKRVLFPQGFHCTGMPIKVSTSCMPPVQQMLAEEVLRQSSAPCQLTA
jgi:hypothetical protein